MKKRKKLGRKLLSFLLALALVLGMFPGMSLTAYAAEVESEEFTTNTGAGIYTGTHIKITGTEGLDTDGDYIGNSTPWTIQGLSGETITRVDMTIGFYGGVGNVSHFRANHGTLSNINDTNNGGFSFINVNSTSITIDCEDNQYALQIKKVVVYYSAGSSYSVTITAGDHMTKTETSGAASQTNLSGAMTDVVYTADGGYYFPEDYSVEAVNGITVTRNSYTQITVSGTPSADAEITLTASTAKTTPAAPTAAAVDCTTLDNNDGKLTGVTTEMEYKKSDATEWTAGTGNDITGLVPGTYYVRVKATDTTNASANQELTIKGFISYTVTFKVVNGKWDEGEGDAATADKTVTLTGHDGDTLKLASNQIPAVGTKPNDTYKAGSWDTEPSTDTAITAATTYTYTYAQKDNISQTVTFKVVNGSWNDETTTDKTVTLTGYEGDTLKLAANQIPAVGDKPNDTYKAGSWDVTPSTETEITAATTYTYTYAQKDNISQTVTFKVVNGSWNDETTTDKTVTLTGYEGDTLKLAANQIPAVGDKPNDTYKAGSWDVTPSTETEITAATTYTYTYVAKEASVVTKAPEAKTLTYNGQAQALVTAGEATGGTMYYAVTTENVKPTDENLYTTSIPAKTNAGTYYVWYKVVGDSNHNDSIPDRIPATIGKRAATITADAKSKVYGEADPTLTATVTGTVGSDTLNYNLNRAAGENAADYTITVTASAEANPNYDITATNGIFTITKREVVISGIVAVDKNYDGTNTASLDFSKASFANLVAADAGKLSVTATGTFEDEKVGKDKKVTISDLALSGDAAGNYVLAANGQQTESQADISNMTAETDGSFVARVEDFNLNIKKVEGLDLELGKSLLTPAEQAAYDAGAKLELDLEIRVAEGLMTDDVVSKVTGILWNQEHVTMHGAKYFDITLYKKVGDADPVKVTDLGSKSITIRMDVPEDMKNTNSDKTRTFFMVRMHSGEPAVLTRTFAEELVFNSNQFSTYAICFNDAPTWKPTPATSSSNNTVTATVVAPKTSGTDETARTLLVFGTAFAVAAIVSRIYVFGRRKEEEE